VRVSSPNRYSCRANPILPRLPGTSCKADHAVAAPLERWSQTLEAIGDLGDWGRCLFFYLLSMAEGERNTPFSWLRPETKQASLLRRPWREKKTRTD